MRHLGLDAGLAVNPDTPFEAYAEHLDKIDLVLLMTVFPGFGGQEFMAEVMPKVRRTREEIDRRGLPVAIQVDGGIDEDTAPIAAEAGAPAFVGSSATLGHHDPLQGGRPRRRAVPRAR